MRGKSNSASGGVGLGVVIFVVFLVLKLTNNIDWSWWWITSPLWIPFAAAGLIGILYMIVMFFAFIYYKIKKGDNNE